MKTALITGINGQDGSYLAELLLSRGYRVCGVVRPETDLGSAAVGSAHPNLEVQRCSLLDEQGLRDIIGRCRPREIYNLGARASSAQLFEDPVLTGEINGLAVVRLLEAIRSIDPEIRFFQAGSSELFGNVLESPQSEATPFRPRNPYGMAKLYAHGMVGLYRERFGLFACGGILFNHESPRRSAHHVTRKITTGAARIEAGLARSLELGDLEATRDWGYAGDYVDAMWRMLQAPEPSDCVVATGESHSVREFCDIAFRRVGLDYQKYVRSSMESRRGAEQVPLVGDATKARARLGWVPKVSFKELVHMMVDADVEKLAGEHRRPPNSCS